MNLEQITEKAKYCSKWESIREQDDKAKLSYLFKVALTCKVLGLVHLYVSFNLFSELKLFCVFRIFLDQLVIDIVDSRNFRPYNHTVIEPLDSIIKELLHNYEGNHVLSKLGKASVPKS